MADHHSSTAAWPTTGPVLRWVLRLVALAAAMISAYLAYVSITGTNAMGCGQDTAFDCASTLSSRHAKWLGIPVSGAATVLYGGLFLATWLLPVAGNGRKGSGWGWPILIAGGTTAAGAGLWFIAQQILLESFCPYCLAVHVCGLILTASVVAGLVVGTNDSGQPFPRWRAGASAGLGLLLVVVLVGGQTLFPGDQTLLAKGPDLPPDPPGVLTVLDGRHRLDLQDVPIIGSPDAPVVIVKLFDYTCAHCKKMHTVLDQFDKRYSDRVAIVMAPVPLAKACNRLMKGTHPKHKDACAFARYGLAVWLADQTRFNQFNEWMFLRPVSPTLKAARSHAVRLVGEQAFTTALRDPWIDARINQFVNIWEDCEPHRVPKILTRRHEAIFDPPDTIYPFIAELLAAAETTANPGLSAADLGGDAAP